MKFLSLVLVAIHTCAILRRSPSAAGDMQEIRKPGDVVIGGLFPFHLQAKRSGDPSVQDAVNCTNFNLIAFLNTQVMIYAIEQINNSTMLPNISLGYKIYDTCSDATTAIKAVFRFMEEKHEPENSCEISIPCNFSTLKPRVNAVIGEESSEISTVVARLLAVPLITQGSSGSSVTEATRVAHKAAIHVISCNPVGQESVVMISYASTSEVLSDKFKYPSFLRTVSGDFYQAKAIALLSQALSWYSIAIIASDDEYGKYGADNIFSFLQNFSLCVDFKEILPSNFSTNDSETQALLKKVIAKIRNSAAEAIVIFTKELDAEIIMKEAAKQGLNRTWIASDSWSTSINIAKFNEIQNAGRVFGFIWKTNNVPGFEDYIRNVQSTVNNSSTWGQYLVCPKTTLLNNLNCSFKAPHGNFDNESEYDNKEPTETCLDLGCFVHQMQMFNAEHYTVYLAVNAIAQGLRSLLKCSDVQCKQSPDFYPQQLHEAVSKVNFTLNGMHLEFDKNGNPSIGYNILSWNFTEREVPFEIIGNYDLGENITIPVSLINEFTNITEILGCDKRCMSGYGLVQKNNNCCKICEPCQNNQYSGGNRETCKTCESELTPNSDHSSCVPLDQKYVEWGNPVALALSIFTAIGILFVLCIAALLAKHHNTPIMKGAGGRSCFIILVALCACFCSVYTFFGIPTTLSCSVGLPLFMLGFTLSVSCIVANLFQIFVGFMLDAELNSKLSQFNRPVAIVVISTGIQGLLCLLQLKLQLPSVEKKESNQVIKLSCTVGSQTIFGIQLAYTALLCIVCFLFAFKGKRLPDLYKNASFMTISMLIYLVVWVLFIPLYIQLIEENKQIIEAAAILVVTYSLLCCHFCPKCYIILFRKEINNERAIVEHIRKHFANKGISTVTSGQ